MSGGGDGGGGDGGGGDGGGSDGGGRNGGGGGDDGGGENGGGGDGDGDGADSTGGDRGEYDKGGEAAHARLANSTNDEPAVAYGVNADEPRNATQPIFVRSASMLSIITATLAVHIALVLTGLRTTSNQPPPVSLAFTRYVPPLVGLSKIRLPDISSMPGTPTGSLISIRTSTWAAVAGGLVGIARNTWTRMDIAPPKEPSSLTHERSMRLRNCVFATTASRRYCASPMSIV